MKRLCVTFLVILLMLGIFSCGLRIPEKIPEKVSVNYTKNLEFPITTFDFKMSQLLDNLISGVGNSQFKILKESPMRLQYATDVSYSPGTILKDVKEQIKSNLLSFSESFSFKLDTGGFLTNLQGTVSLPQMPSQDQESIIDISEVSINNLILANNIPILMGPNDSLSLGDLLASLPFDEANFKECTIELSFSGIGGSNLGIIIDGTERPFNTKISLFIKKTSSFILKNKSSTTVSGNLTLKFTNLKLNYFKNLKVSDVTSDGKITINIPSQNVSIASGNWLLKLGGKIKEEIIIPGFSGSITQTINLKSGSVNLGSQSSNSLLVEVPVNEVYFKVGEGIQVSGNVQLSGIVSADLRSEKPKVKVTPNITVKAVKNFEFTVDVPKPDVVQSISFTSDSGYMVVNFTGLALKEATTTFGETIKDSNVKVSFKGVSLPKQIKVVLEADVTSSNISYQASLPSGQTIKIASAVVDSSLIADKKVDIQYPIPDFVKTIVNSLDANIAVKIRYNIRGINGLKMNISSNFFEVGTGEVTFNDTSGSEKTHILSANKNINFSTFNKFELKIEPSLSNNITLSNVDLNEGAYIIFTPEIDTFNISNVSIKEQQYQFDNLTTLNLDQLFANNLEFLKEFDYEISTKVRFDITNSTIPATVVLNVSGTNVVINKGEEKDIGDLIENLIKQGGILQISAKIKTKEGVLNENSEIKLSLNLDMPFSLTAKGKDIIVNSGPVNQDLSILKQISNIVQKAELKFKTWNNTTGLSVRLKLKEGTTEILNTDISSAHPVITLTKEQMQRLGSGGISYEIIVPKDQKVSLNYTGKLAMAPYIAVELSVATEVKLK